MNYPADPGEVFASDAHRRVMANAPNPEDEALTADAIVAYRIAKDDYLELEEAELTEILNDLEADGYVEHTEDGWKNTLAGFDVLTGSIEEIDD